MTYFEHKMRQRLVDQSGAIDRGQEEELFYASYGAGTAFFANLWGWLARRTKAPARPRPQVARLHAKRATG